MLENVDDGRCDPLSVFCCFRATKTFQNRGEGFDVREENGGLLILGDVANQTTKLFDRCHTKSDVVDDEILNFSGSKKRTEGFNSGERTEKRHDSVGCFSFDDETFLGDEEISNVNGVVFIISWERIDCRLQLRRSRSASKRRDQRIHNFFIYLRKKKITATIFVFLLIKSYKVNFNFCSKDKHK